MKLLAVNIEPDGSMGVKLLADSSLLRSGQPFFVPDHAPHYAVQPMLALRVGRLGKCIAKRFAHRYIDAVTATFVVKPVDQDLRPSSLGGLEDIMDGAAMMGNWQPCESITHLPTLQWSHNGTEHQITPQELEPAIDEVIEKISRYCTLKMGDIVCVGTAEASLQPIAINDRLTAGINGLEVTHNRIK